MSIKQWDLGPIYKTVSQDVEWCSNVRSPKQFYLDLRKNKGFFFKSKNNHRYTM